MPPRTDDDVLTTLRKLKGVVLAEYLDATDREALVRLATSSAADNRGVADVLRRERVLCLFKDGTFRPPPEPTVVLVDDAGNVLGRELVTEEDRRTSADRRLAYLGKDFVLVPGVRPTGSMRFLLPSVRFPELEPLRTIDHVVSASPDPPQDDHLRHRFRVAAGNELASILVGFDRRKP